MATDILLTHVFLARSSMLRNNFKFVFSNHKTIIIVMNEIKCCFHKSFTIRKL